MWNTLQSQYNYLFLELRDPRYAVIKMPPPTHVIIDDVRVDDWFLMSSPWPTAAACLLYYYIIRQADISYKTEMHLFHKRGWARVMFKTRVSLFSG